jgi:hypothetical protein
MRCLPSFNELVQSELNVLLSGTSTAAFGQKMTPSVHGEMEMRRSVVPMSSGTSWRNTNSSHSMN